MKIATSVAEMRAARAQCGGLGFAPTMGALHEGHLSLVRLAKRDFGCAAVSIFVNPTQFNEGADFDRYPRTLESDLEKLASVDCDIVFAPTASVMYPAGFGASIDVGPVALPLEGAMRPGHFKGVATVVAKLLNIVQPTRAYFGQKDAQQLVVIRQMVRDLDLPVDIVGAPTIREADGLAMSSRNALLDPRDRAVAAVLYRALGAAQAAHRAGEGDAARLRSMIAAMIGSEPRARTEYVSIADRDTLAELDRVGPAGALASLAVRFGDIRLIDNVFIGGPA